VLVDVAAGLRQGKYHRAAQQGGHHAVGATADEDPVLDGEAGPAHPEHRAGDVVCGRTVADVVVGADLGEQLLGQRWSSA
jgi:hypothetical protein